MRNKITLEIEWGDKLPFKVGSTYTKGELLSWRREYTSPKNLTEAFFQASKIIKHDFNLHFNNLCDRTKYLIAEIQEVYRSGKRVFVLSLLAGTSVPIMSFTIANNLPFKEIINPQLNVGNGITCLSCGINGDYKNTGVYSKEELEEIINVESTEKEKIKKARLDRKNKEKLRKIKAQAKALKSSITNLDLQAKVDNLSPKDEATLVLNLSEGLYFFPYFDYGQFSVGYGSYISKKDCIKLWSRMGLSESEGTALAYKVHYLQKQKGGYSKVQKILKEYSNWKGAFTEKEADELREKEWAKFYQHVNEKFTYLPEFQRRILANVAYNTGWVGFYGSNGKKINGKVFPKSRLAYCLEHYKWDDKRVYDAFTLLKTHVTVKDAWGNKKLVFLQGLYNRRCNERDAFFSDSNVVSQKNHVNNIKKQIN